MVTPEANEAKNRSGRDNSFIFEHNPKIAGALSVEPNPDGTYPTVEEVVDDYINNKGMKSTLVVYREGVFWDIEMRFMSLNEVVERAMNRLTAEDNYIRREAEVVHFKGLDGSEFALIFVKRVGKDNDAPPEKNKRKRRTYRLF